LELFRKIFHGVVGKKKEKYIAARYLEKRAHSLGQIKKNVFGVKHFRRKIYCPKNVLPFYEAS